MLIFGNWGGVPAVPEQPDGGLVPPVKVLRKRLNGVYRADGFSGPTRRYVLVVALLVGLASLPTLAAITAGTRELDRGTTGAMDVPFLPPPSPGAVVPARPSPLPSSGVVHGQAGKRRTMPYRYDRRDVPRSGFPSMSPQAGSAVRGDTPANVPLGRPARPGHPVPPRENRPVPPGHPEPPAEDDSDPPGHGVPPNEPADPARPADPDDQPPPVRSLLCHERGRCGVRESWHHRPDWSRHRQCEDATRRAHWSHHREGRSRTVVVPIVPTGRHGVRAAIREHSRRFPAQQVISSISQDRSERTRRSTVTERPSNVRPPSWGDRTHNSRRHDSESSREHGHGFGRPYRGAHRVDDLAAHDRSSRVGRHHAHTERW
jgi:hypothetical protein